MAYKVGAIGELEARMAAKLVGEQYRFSYPELTYKVLDTTETILDADYGDTRRTDRVYKEFPMWLQPIYNPEEMGLSAFGIDRTRQILFFASTYLFDNQNIEPKPGDIILWENDSYEVATFKPKADSEIAKTNFFTEMELVANIPAPDSRS